MNIKSHILQCLKKTYLLQIATSSDNIPWVCTVCFAFDTSYNLYWFSRFNTRHSKEITQNPNVAATIAIPYVLGEKSKGLQIIGKAFLLTDKKEIEKGIQTMSTRYKVEEKRVNVLKTELLDDHDADYGIYCLKPTTIFLHDTIHFPESPRQILEV